MNDRYLFRGKRIDNGEWVVGNLSQWNDGDVFIVRQYHQFDKEQYKVIPETVGQCTGLKDKNGKLIFEGDILLDSKKRGVVKYENSYYIFWWKNFDKYRPDFFKNCILTDYTSFSNLEIIGNVMDNPELLEVEE